MEAAVIQTLLLRWLQQEAVPLSCQPRPFLLLAASGWSSAIWCKFHRKCWYSAKHWQVMLVLGTKNTSGSGVFISKVRAWYEPVSKPRTWKKWSKKTVVVSIYSKDNENNKIIFSLWVTETLIHACQHLYLFYTLSCTTCMKGAIQLKFVKVIDWMPTVNLISPIIILWGITNKVKRKTYI